MKKEKNAITERMTVGAISTIFMIAATFAVLAILGGTDESAMASPEPTPPVEAAPAKTIRSMVVVEYPEQLTTTQPATDDELELETEVAESLSPADIYDIPAADTGAKRYMDYRTITDKTSDQYKLQQSDHTWTDEFGFRRYGNMYMVAMGTYYSGRCGKIFDVTFDSGATIRVLISDVKADAHTDPLHQHRQGNVIEFIVDSQQIPRMAQLMGDMQYADETFVGKIEKIVFVGFVD